MWIVQHPGQTSREAEVETLKEFEPCTDMLIQFLLAIKSRHALMRDTYRKFMQSYLEFAHICEQRAIAVEAACLTGGLSL